MGSKNCCWILASRARDAASDGLSQIHSTKDDSICLSGPPSPPRSPVRSLSPGEPGNERRPDSLEVEHPVVRVQSPQTFFSSGWRSLRHRIAHAPTTDAADCHSSFGELSTIATTASTPDLANDSWDNSGGSGPGVDSEDVVCSGGSRHRRHSDEERPAASAFRSLDPAFHTSIDDNSNGYSNTSKDRSNGNSNDRNNNTDKSSHTDTEDTQEQNTRREAENDCDGPNQSDRTSNKKSTFTVWERWRRGRQQDTKMTTSTGVPLITTLGCTASGLAPIPISVSDVDVELDLPKSPFGSGCLSPPLGQGLSSSASSLNRLCVPGQGLSHSAPGSPRERKLSLPSSLHQRRPSLSGYAAAAENARENARLRKLSSVGASMSHRLSTSIGWKAAPVTAAEVTEQAKALCGRYLRAKLRSCGPMHKKLGLQRLKSVSNMCSGYPTNDVSTKLRLICQELERTHPETFQTVVGNIGVHSLPSESAVQAVFECVARELFRNDISWGRVAALYSLSGGLAIDCVKLGHPEYIMTIVNSLALFVERDLAQWIAQQGGWSALISRFKTESTRSRFLEVVLMCIVVILVLLAVRQIILR